MGTARHERLLVVVISSVHFVQHVFRILPPVLPLLVVAFPYPLWKLGALVSVYFMGSGLGQTPMGILVDRHDRRFVLPPSVAMMGAGYLVFALAPGLVPPSAASVTVAGEPFTVQFLLMGLGTFIAGLGASAIHPTGYPLVITNVPAGREGRALGGWGAAAKFGDAAAPTAIALLILVVTWNDIFLIFGVVGVVYAAFLFYVMSLDWMETRPAEQRDDPPQDDDPGGGDPSPGWRGDRRRYVYPMLALFVFFVARAFSEKGLKTFLPTFISEVYGYSFTFAGVYVPPESFADLYFTAMFLVAAAATLVTGRLVDRFDPRAVLIAFFAVASIAMAVFAAGSLSPLALLSVLVVLGVSNWGWIPARDAIIGEFTPPARAGRTFGYLHTISHLFSAAAPIAIGFVAEASSLRASFLYLAVVMVVAIVAIASLYSRRVYRPVDREEHASMGD